MTNEGQAAPCLRYAWAPGVQFKLHPIVGRSQRSAARSSCIPARRLHAGKNHAAGRSVVGVPQQAGCTCCLNSCQSSALDGA